MSNLFEAAPTQELESLLLEQKVSLSSEQLKLVLGFYDKLVAENRIQNLTRLISPSDFIQGHLIDVLSLLKSGLLSFPALDLGSGGGVPGLLAACLKSGEWVLSDSEARKAEFLSKTVKDLGLSDVKVTAERAEKFLKSNSVSSVVARAVGPVERIYSWLHPCSTWNNLVLFKGPGWEKEWQEFSSGKFKGRLVIESRFDYVVGVEEKKRVIIRLARVPRGTK